MTETRFGVIDEIDMDTPFGKPFDPATTEQRLLFCDMYRNGEKR